MKDLIYLEDAKKAMIELEEEDIRLYGVAIPEGFDSEVAIDALEKLKKVNAISIEDLQELIKVNAISIEEMQELIEKLIEKSENTEG